METKELTVGESRVGTNFNVSGSTNVDYFKQKTANLINACEDLKKANVTDARESYNVGEHMRLISLAQTAYEEAAMWAVKAATF